MSKRNVISVFTEDEVHRALSLVAAPDAASAVAAELYALPPEEQVHLDWIQSTLLLLSCVSEELARRVVDNFAPEPEAQVRMREEQARFGEWVRSPDSPARESGIELEDVVHDSRRDVGLMSGVQPGEDGAENLIALFSQQELGAALSLVAAPELAARVAADIYTLSPIERSGLAWTDVALGLLSSVSEDLARRVATALGTTPERLREVTDMQSLFHDLLESGEIRQMHVSLDTIVRRVSEPSETAL